MIQGIKVEVVTDEFGDKELILKSPLDPNDIIRIAPFRDGCHILYSLPDDLELLN